MQTYIDDVEETLSLSNFYKEDDTITSSQRSLSSSSSSSLSDQDFLGFFSDEWNGNTSYGGRTLPENIVFCGKVISSGEPMARDRNAVTETQTGPLFRSNSDSFRFMRLKTSMRRNTTRSNSLPNKSASFSYKSKWMVFMFGSGQSSKFLNKVEMSDIKSRQLRRQSSMTVSAWVESGKEKNGGQKSGSKGWWRVVDVLGCGGGYEKDTNLGVI